MACKMKFSYNFLMEGVHIWHNDCLWSVDNNEGFRSPIIHWSEKLRSNILKICLAAHNTNPSFVMESVHI